MPRSSELVRIGGSQRIKTARADVISAYESCRPQKKPLPTAICLNGCATCGEKSIGGQQSMLLLARTPHTPNCECTAKAASERVSHEVNASRQATGGSQRVTKRRTGAQTSLPYRANVNGLEVLQAEGGELGAVERRVGERAAPAAQRSGVPAETRNTTP